MLVSLVIPTFNRSALLERCLRSALSQTYPELEIIVVDDCSTDATSEMVRAKFTDVKYYRQLRNTGPAGARNAGIQMARGDIVAFTDDDCLLPEDFIARLSEGFDEYPQVAGVGGYMEAPDEVLGHNLLAQYEAYVTHVVYKAGTRPYLGGCECPAGGTNAMAYRRSVLEQVGGFDEAFPFAGGEDTDLKVRVVRAGGKLLYIPVKVTHLRDYTLSGLIRQHVNYGKSAVIFESKHTGRVPTRWRLLLRLGARCLRWFRNLVTIGPALASVQLLANLADLRGQWYEVRLLKANR